MYPPLMHELARDKTAEMNRKVSRAEALAQISRPSRPALACQRSRPLKERAGWALIHVGLRLTGPGPATADQR